MRTSPNIIVTGTPGVGKTGHCELLAEETGLRHLSINDVVKGKECHDGWDKELLCWIVDEDKLLDAIEDDVLGGGCIIDWHACDLFPSSWIDLVVVLRADTTILYDRLADRKYSEVKLQENLDAEIMEVLLDEAREAYEEEIIIELHSNTTQDLESNVSRITSWITQWKTDNSQGVDGRSRVEEGEDEEAGSGDSADDKSNIAS